MKFFGKAVFAAAIVVPTLSHADNCTPWMDTGTGVQAMICAYENGGSGYYKWRNVSDSDKSFSFRISGPGGSFNGAKSNLGSGDEESSACHQCRVGGSWSVNVSNVRDAR
jgi:hypothetical protein